MPTLPNPTAVTYNGFTFPVEAKTTASFTFVPDAAKRTVVETRLQLTVRAKVIAGAAQDATLDAIRAALERPGGQLTVAGLGLGTLAINTPAGKKDLSWGPFPAMMSWENPGGGRAANVVWQCDVHVIGCLGAPDSGQVMEFTWDVTFATDNGGYTTRTINAELRIPMTRVAVGDPTVPDSADAYLDRFLPVQAPGFSRHVTRTVNRAKDGLTFTVTDAELGGWPLPDGVVSATASLTFNCDEAVALVKWHGSLTAAYEVARNRRRAQTWDNFKELARDRLGRLHDRGWRFFPVGLSLGEPEIYGRQAGAFALQFVMFRKQGDGAARAVPVSGLWAPPPNATWQSHSNSLAQGAQAPRGFAQGRVNAGDDQIFDLCVGTGRTASLQRSDPSQDDGGDDDFWQEIKSVLRTEDNPDPACTWLRYRCVTDQEEHNRLHAHFPLPTGPDPNGGTSTLRTPGFNGPPGAFPQTADTFALATQDSPAPVVQYGGSPGYFVRLVGQALRFAYEIPRPVPPTVGGQSPVDANDPRLGTFWRAGLVGWTTHPIYAARWNLRYFVPRRQGQPSTLAPVMPHPFQQANAPVR